MDSLARPPRTRFLLKKIPSASKGEGVRLGLEINYI